MRTILIILISTNLFSQAYIKSVYTDGCIKASCNYPFIWNKTILSIKGSEYKDNILKIKVSYDGKLVKIKSIDPSYRYIRQVPCNNQMHTYMALKDTEMYRIYIRCKEDL